MFYHHSPQHCILLSHVLVQDADAEIVVVASATQYVTSHLAMRSKVYSVLGSIRWGHGYAPCVVPPKRSSTGHAQVDWSRFHDVTPIHPSARRRTTRQQPSGLVQQQQQPSSWDRQQYSMSEQWTGSSVHAAPDAYSSQISEVLENMTAGSFSALRQQQQDGWQQHQQQHRQQHEVHVGLLRQQMREAEAAAQALEVGWERSSGDANAAGRVGRSSSLPGSVPITRESSQRQLQQQQQIGQFGSSFGATSDAQQLLAHSLGFAERHNAGQQPVYYQQQQVRQGVTSASQLHETVATGAADLFDEEHTFAVLPKRADSWKGKRSLAAVLDLFEAAPTAEQSAADGDVTASTSGQQP